MSRKKAVVIYSGGMDSRTVLQLAVDQLGPENVIALSFDYNQKHIVELSYAEKVCEKLNVNHRIVKLGFIGEIAGSSALTSADVEVPEGHYEAKSMESTVVPNRNMVMLSIALSLAISEDAEWVYYGAHSGDHHIYPDCRPAFIDCIDSLAKLIHKEPLTIVAPYTDGSKQEILEDGLRMGIDYGETWTCYNGGNVPCGKCGACQERAEAFSNLGLEDPLLAGDDNA